MPLRIPLPSILAFRRPWWTEGWGRRCTPRAGRVAPDLSMSTAGRWGRCRWLVRRCGGRRHATCNTCCLSPSMMRASLSSASPVVSSRRSSHLRFCGSRATARKWGTTRRRRRLRRARSGGEDAVDRRKGWLAGRLSRQTSPMSRARTEEVASGGWCCWISRGCATRRSTIRRPRWTLWRHGRGDGRARVSARRCVGV